MKVFISYRRADSQAMAGRMAQFLDAIPRVDEVFLDVDGISPGENFEQKIRDTLAGATHVFVLIGAQWTGPGDGTARARIFEGGDVVHNETRLALASQAKVVPILLDGTIMPGPEDLPEDLRPIAKINAFALRTAQFDEDMDTLLDALFGNRHGRGSRWRRATLTPAGIAQRLIIAVTASAVLLLAVAVANHFGTRNEGLVGTLMALFGIIEADAWILLWLTCVVVFFLCTLAAFMPRRESRKR